MITIYSSHMTFLWKTHESERRYMSKQVDNWCWCWHFRFENQGGHDNDTIERSINASIFPYCPNLILLALQPMKLSLVS